MSIKLLDFTIKEMGVKVEIRIERETGLFIWKVPNRDNEHAKFDRLEDLKQFIRDHFLKPEEGQDEIWVLFWFSRGYPQTALRRIPKHQRQRGSFRGYNVESWSLNEDGTAKIHQAGTSMNHWETIDYKQKGRWVKATPEALRAAKTLEQVKAAMVKARSMTNCDGTEELVKNFADVNYSEEEYLAMVATVTADHLQNVAKVLDDASSLLEEFISGGLKQ